MIANLPFGDGFDRGLYADRTEGGDKARASTSEIETSIDVLDARKTTTDQKTGVRRNTIMIF